MIDPERIQRLAAKLGNRNDALEFVRQMRCGGKKYDGGGKYFRTELQSESPLMYQPMMPVYPDVAVPERYYPEPNLGDYEYPESMGMIQAMPIQMNVPVSAPPTGVLADEVTVPVSDLFSDEAKARRRLKQRYAESRFNDSAVSGAGAMGAWQIMPITLKDYLGRGRGKKGDINNAEYNGRIRDWVMGIIPRDLQEFWSDDDSDINKLAKLYAAYNWGAGNLRSFLRKKQKAGVDISNPDNWVDDLNPETRRYVKYLAFDEDIPDSIYTNSAFEDAARARGYMAEGGRIHINPKNKGKFTALLKRTGKSASWFKEHGTPLQRKRATFALNARKWRHDDGGFINTFEDGGDEEKVPWYRLPVRVPNMTGTATAAATSLRDIPLTDSTVGRELAVAGTAMLPLAPYLGHSAAVGIDTMGRMAMPSTLLKGVSYYVPKAAGALSAVSPWLDAGALSLWSAEAGKAAIDAKRQGRTGDAIGMGTLAALPIVMPLGMKAYQGMKNGLRMKPFEIGNVSSAELYDPIVGHSTAPPEAYLAEEVARENAEIAGLGRETLLAEPTDLNFFNNKALRLMAEQGNAKAAAELATRPYEIENLGGGYMLKSLMRGNPLEKQLSKNGTVNVNNVRALVGKGSKVEQAVVDKVLASEEFAGKKVIDYNKFRKAVQDELITYKRTPDTRWATYGEDAIGFRAGSPTELREINEARTFNDKRQVIEVYGTYEEKMQLRDMTHLFRDGEMTEAEYDDAFDKLFSDFSHKRTGGAKSETYVFSSSRIPNGSAKHYDPNTLGHSRTYTTVDEPDVLHVMESQSDWAQSGKVASRSEIENQIASLEQSLAMQEENLKNNGRYFAPKVRNDIEGNIDYLKGQIEEYNARLKDAAQSGYLRDNYTSRQIQENLRYAAEKGQKKMRYPTRETAAKIEGYPKREAYFDASGKNVTTDSNIKLFTYGEELDKELDSIASELDVLKKTNPLSEVNLDKSIKDIIAGNERRAKAIKQLEKGEPVEDSWYRNYTLEELNEEQAGELVRLEAYRNAKKAGWGRQMKNLENRRLSIVRNHEAELRPGITKRTVYDYEDILHKYTEFPKQFKKLYKNSDVRIVTDPKGNTWYEVDVPENYLQQEWAYEEGGSLILPKMMMSKHSPDKLRSAIASIRARQKK